MKQIIPIFILLWSLTNVAISQNIDNQYYKTSFQSAHKACPDIPNGLLEAISFTNTHVHHLTDANYFHDGPDAMPRAYGLMGLVKDGKGYFRENLKIVAELSGISEAEILESPEKNVLAYAKAFEHLSQARKATELKDYMDIIKQLSELPTGEEKDVYPMQSMLYSVCCFLNDTDRAKEFGFQAYQIDIKALFGESYEKLVSPGLSITRSPDYPPAIWDPAPECNWEPRTKEVSAVVIHYTEGSYAGCISWFKNCDAEVSAHYVIRSADGQVTQMVREADKAWHARTANGYTIGIEHEAYGNIWSFFTEAMYQSSADLVRSICSRYETINGLRTHDRDTLDNGLCLNDGLFDLGGEGACVKIRGHQHYPDQSHTDPGPYWDWDYYYKLINEGTPVTLMEGTEGRLDHQNYSDDERLIWVIKCPEGSIIELDFSSFHLEADFDFLRIYDGDNVYAPKIGRWNTQSPGKVRSSNRSMCVEFRSDCATNTTGWEASWKALTGSVVSSEHATKTHVTPNPFHDHFTIVQEDEAITEISVYDLLGNTVLPWTQTEGSMTVQTNDWPSGVYIVHLKDSSLRRRTVKLIKL